MNNLLTSAETIHRVAGDMRGVFSLSDLRNLLGPANKYALYRALRRLQEAGIISRFARGFYVTPGFDAAALSQRICPDSYISFGTILAGELLIGSVPARRITAVKTGPSRTYANDELCIEHLRITDSLYFGYRRENGINRALPEKAVLDTLYFYKQGKTFSFDIYDDIDYEQLDRRKIDRFLKRYRNRLFVAFARKVIHG